MVDSKMALKTKVPKSPAPSLFKAARWFIAEAEKRGLSELIRSTVTPIPDSDADVLALDHRITQICEELTLEVIARDKKKQLGLYKKTQAPDAPPCFGWSGVSQSLIVLRNWMPEIFDPTGPIQLFRSKTVIRQRQEDDIKRDEKWASRPALLVTTLPLLALLLQIQVDPNPQLYEDAALVFIAGGPRSNEFVDDAGDVQEEKFMLALSKKREEVVATVRDLPPGIEVEAVAAAWERLHAAIPSALRGDTSNISKHLNLIEQWKQHLPAVANLISAYNTHWKGLGNFTLHDARSLYVSLMCNSVKVKNLCYYPHFAGKFLGHSGASSGKCYSRICQDPKQHYTLADAQAYNKAGDTDGEDSSSDAVPVHKSPSLITDRATKKARTDEPE